MKLRFSFSKNVDFNALTRIFKEVGWKGRNVAGLRRAVKNSYLFLTAYDEKKLIGSTRVLSDGVFYASIWDVVVLPEYQNKGVGKKMMSKVIKKIRGKKFKFVGLFDGSGRPKFYSSMGFVVKEKLPGRIFKESRDFHGLP